MNHITAAKRLLALGARRTVAEPASFVDASRRAFLSRSSALVAGGAAALVTVSATGTARADHNAVKIHQRGKQRDEFESIQQHENDHVAFLVQALGTAARPKPTFQNLEQEKFKDFAELAQALENTGVGAYLGAAPFLDAMENLAAAGSIATIEARHAGYLNTYLGDSITGTVADDGSTESFETALTAEQVVAGAGPFIANLNGGPPVDYSVIPSPENDIAILNFALALEYLEAEFYNINVPKFFKPRKG